MKRTLWKTKYRGNLTATVNGTSYNFTYFTGTYNDNISKFSTTLMPWWGSQSTAVLFASAVAGNLEYPNQQSTPYKGPYFAYSYNHIPQDTMNPYNIGLEIFYNNKINSGFTLPSNTRTYAIATVNTGAAAVPEIDGALIPQVGLLIAGLFLILGRKKQNPEPMLVRLSEC